MIRFNVTVLLTRPLVLAGIAALSFHADVLRAQDGTQPEAEPGAERAPALATPADATPISKITASDPQRYLVRMSLIIESFANRNDSGVDYKVPEEGYKIEINECGIRADFDLLLAMAGNSSHLELDRTDVKSEYHELSQNVSAKYKERATLSDGLLETGQAPDEAQLRWQMKNRGNETLYLTMFSIGLDVERQLVVYNSRVNDRAAARIARPNQWDESLAPYLASDRFIESGNLMITDFLSRLTRGKAADAKPYLLARALLQAVVERSKNVEPLVIRKLDPEIDKDRRPLGVDPSRPVCGLNMKGALNFLQTGKGSPHDAVCLFVALCRAANIPARPVVGFDYKEQDTLISWAEFYVPELGWIPVDVQRFIESPGLVHDINRPWAGFGTWDGLNQRIPLAYRFQPTAEYATTNPWPLFWGAKPYLDAKTVQWFEVDAQKQMMKRKGR